MMMLNDESKKRYTAFWENDAYDRILTYIAVGEEIEPRPNGMRDDEWYGNKWADIDFRMKNAREYNDNVRYYLDGFPTRFINFGPGSLASSIGGNHVYADSTIWFDRNPIIKDWNNYPEIKFDENTELWQKTIEYTDAVLNDGSMFASIADLGGIVDVVASLRGSQELLYDMYDYPDEVKKLTTKVRECWKQAYTILTDRIMSRQEGMTSWMSIWCKDRYAPLQCDFSAMISPDMFEEFILPDLKECCNFLDKSIYHLDGPGEIPHVDHLLSIPNLNAIQWVSGAGNPDMGDECWFDLYDKIQAGGKGLVLLSVKPELLEKLINHISPKGVYIGVDDCDDYTAKKIEEMIIKKGINK